MSERPSPLVERVARAVCAAGGGDPDRLLDGEIHTVTGDVQFEVEYGRCPRTGKPLRKYAFWRCFQTEARAAIAVLCPDEAR